MCRCTASKKRLILRPNSRVNRLWPTNLKTMAPAGGVCFRELMVGGFVMGETDPVAGEREGLRSRSFLSMHAWASIPDVARFVQDPDHAGQLTGTVSFAPLATNANTTQGEFKLFVPVQQPPGKEMVYRMCFRAEGKNFCLHGVKSVLRRSVIHSWKDTTTLFCRLHEGTAETETVVGAGTLHLSMLQFAKQLTSFRTLNAPSLAQKGRALAEFGNFFARELIDTYFG
jgi:hypothetical protein